MFKTNNNMDTRPYLDITFDFWCARRVEAIQVIYKEPDRHVVSTDHTQEIILLFTGIIFDLW
jgi:hypothetical protein